MVSDHEYEALRTSYMETEEGRRTFANEQMRALWDEGMRAIALLEQADILVDEAETLREYTYSVSQAPDEREWARDWLEKLQALRDGLVEHRFALEKIHGAAVQQVRAPRAHVQSTLSTV